MLFLLQTNIFIYFIDEIARFAKDTLVLFNNFLFLQIMQAAFCFALSSMVLLMVNTCAKLNVFELRSLNANFFF